ncbi:2-hydroxychromene-2-carboxylate isomerase [Pseudomonas sp. AA-38]|uniref:2-hydroxychromene-2-carboxylate isomerase n=1 Tax=Pseudomonas sp. AA-38 TaxID=3028807 RepID=UPI0023F632F7|nr:2-hydroxychromene-2-carboxylate isomerase [Pseudomonas sp. AA-38]
MSKTVEFFFDLGSPASYLAHTQLPALCREAGAELLYRPMLLGAVFQATGNASPVLIPAKGRYLMRDLARCAERFAVPLRFNPHFPINTLALMRLLVAVQMHQPARLYDAVHGLFEAIWVGGANLADPACVSEVLVGAGFDAAVLQAQSVEPEVKAALKASTEEAVARGVFGAPTCFVEGEMFFGQDRLDFVHDALCR